MADLTAEEINKIQEQVALLRKKLRSTGATALSPTPEWDVMRKEVAVLNKKLNADTVAKDKARKALLSAEQSA